MAGKANTNKDVPCVYFNKFQIGKTKDGREKCAIYVSAEPLNSTPAVDYGIGLSFKLKSAGGANSGVDQGIHVPKTEDGKLYHEWPAAKRAEFRKAFEGLKQGSKLNNLYLSSESPVEQTLPDGTTVPLKNFYWCLSC